MLQTLPWEAMAIPHYKGVCFLPIPLATRLPRDGHASACNPICSLGHTCLLSQRGGKVTSSSSSNQRVLSLFDQDILVETVLRQLWLPWLMLQTLRNQLSNSKCKHGAGLKCLLCKRKYPSPDSQHPHKKLGAALGICNSSVWVSRGRSIHRAHWPARSAKLVL